MVTFKRILDHDYYLPVLLLAGALVIRLVNLTKLPIFNDEAIYLDWGWRAFHLPGQLFVSLYDAKQPFIIWLFGIIQGWFKDPLLGGRLVSVLFGGMSVWGTYLLGREIHSKLFGLIAATIYALCPLFLFFDRQALLESGIIAVGIWLVYAGLKYLKTNQNRYLLLLGFILGLGLFMKTSVLLFVFAHYTFLMMYWFTRGKEDKQQMILGGLGSMLVSIMVLLPLILQTPFWKNLYSNSRYVLTLPELLHFPVAVWGQSLWATLQISFWHLTPFVAALVFVGVVNKLKTKTTISLYLSYVFLIPLVLYLLSARVSTVRYVAPYLVLAPFFAANSLWSLSNSKVRLSLGFLTCTVLTVISFLLVSNPFSYFTLISKVTPYSQQTEYVTGWPSGYGIPEVISLLQEKGRQQPLIAAVRYDFGNPESAIFTYFNDSPTVAPIFFDRKIVGLEGDTQTACITSNVPLYFIARDANLGGLDRFLSLVKTYQKPEGKHSINLYTLKQPCEGKSLALTF